MTDAGELTKHESATVDTNVLEQVVVGGDLAQLTARERVEYYSQVCKSLALNPLTRPFAYIKLQGRLTLYALRGATDQLRRIHGVSVEDMRIEQAGGLVTVTLSVTTGDGRKDIEVGVVPLPGAPIGDANAVMKAVTKAKRRATLSAVGLGWLDETEAETIPDAKIVTVNEDTGEIESEQAASFEGNGWRGFFDTAAAKTGISVQQLKSYMGDPADYAHLSGNAKSDLAKQRISVGLDAAMAADGVSERAEGRRNAPPADTAHRARGRRPETPDAVRARIQAAVATLEPNNIQVSDGERGAMTGALESLLPDIAPAARAAQRHLLCRYLVGAESSKEMNGAQVRALANWAQDYVDNQYVPNQDAKAEAGQIIVWLEQEEEDAATRTP